MLALVGLDLLNDLNDGGLVCHMIVPLAFLLSRLVLLLNGGSLRYGGLYGLWLLLGQMVWDLLLILDHGLLFGWGRIL